MTPELASRILNVLRSAARTGRNAEEKAEAQACIDELTAEPAAEAAQDPHQLAVDVQAENIEAEKAAYARTAKATETE